MKKIKEGLKNLCNRIPNKYIAKLRRPMLLIIAIGFGAGIIGMDTVLEQVSFWFLPVMIIFILITTEKLKPVDDDNEDETKN